MLNVITYFDEITVWWEKPWDGENYSYRVFSNGKAVAETDKTHYTFTGLTPSTVYEIQVEILCGNSTAAKERITVETSAAKKKVDITKPPYFAVGDGKTVNTCVLREAAEKLKKDEYLYFPKGVYLTGSFCVHGDTEIYIDEGAEIKGSESCDDYLPKIITRFEGVETLAYSPLIKIGEMNSKAGQTTENIIIRGKGSITGGGKALCDKVIETEKERLKDYLAENAEYVKTCECDKTIPGRARPFLIDICNAKNVSVSGVEIGYGAAWNLHFVYCESVNVFGCRFASDGVWNGDGIDPDSSENIAIFGCAFYTHDDAIAVKSGKNPEGNKINRPTENLRIFDCHGRNGIALGSEMSGGLEDIYIWDCRIFESYSGLRGKVTPKRGGYIRNVRVRDCAFASIIIGSVPFNDDGESSGSLSEVVDWQIKNVILGGFSLSVSGKKTPLPAIEIRGFENSPASFRNISVKNSEILLPKESKDALVIVNAKNIATENLTYCK